MKWIGAFEKKPKRVFVVHGEDTVTDVFAARIKDELGIDAVAPYTGAEYDLLTNECLQLGTGTSYAEEGDAAQGSDSL
mgnify:CR=1 FL=1